MIYPGMSDLEVETAIREAVGTHIPHKFVLCFHEKEAVVKPTCKNV